MAAQNLRWRSGAAIAATSFGLGVVVGLFVKGAADRAVETARRKQAHRDSERTATFDDNLPAPLERREPLPETSQPRFGGTGALGVSPIAAERAASEDR